MAPSNSEADSAFESGSDDAEIPEVPEDGGCAPGWLGNCVKSEQFQYVVGTVITLNVVAMYFQADYPVSKLPPSQKDLWPNINGVFLAFFFAEIVLKMFVYGIRKFFCDETDGGWNMFDFFIVFTGVFDYASRTIKYLTAGQEEPSDQFSVLIRTLRILRVLRVIKLMRQMKELKRLARGLTQSFRYIFWIAVLIIFFIFVCAIVTTQVIGQSADQWGDDADEIRKYFGSTLVSMFTLFQFMTLDDWNYVLVLVIREMPALELPLFLYVIISAFILLSLLTGSMVEHMQQVTQEEEEEEEEALIKTSTDQLSATMARVFSRGDSDQNMKIDKDEFGKVFDKKEVAKELAADDIQLSGAEAIELFPLFDKDGDGFLSVQEFKQGLDEYRRGLTMRNVMSLKRDMKYMAREVTTLHKVPDAWRGGAKKATPTAERAILETESSMMQLESRLMAFDTKIASLRKLVMHHFTDDEGDSVESE